MLNVHTWTCAQMFLQTYFSFTAWLLVHRQIFMVTRIWKNPKTPLYCFRVYRKPVFFWLLPFFDDIFHVQHLFVQVYILENSQ